jgi:hypothetical protein
MDTLTPFQRLDVCLNIIHQEEEYKSVFSRIEETLGVILAPGEIDCMLDKLHQDGYTDHVIGQKLTDLRASDGMNIRRSYHGELFMIIEKGYEGREMKRREDAKAMKIYNENMGNHTRRLAVWTERLTYATYLAAAAGVGVLLWGMRHWIDGLFS